MYNIQYEIWLKKSDEDRAAHYRSRGPVPDHSTFSKNRHGRFRESAAYRLVFESVVGTCTQVGLVGGEGFAADASVIEADASRYKRVEGSEVDWTDKQKVRRPVQAYRTTLETRSEPRRRPDIPRAGFIDPPVQISNTPFNDRGETNTPRDPTFSTPSANSGRTPTHLNSPSDPTCAKL